MSIVLCTCQSSTAGVTKPCENRTSVFLPGMGRSPSQIAAKEAPVGKTFRVGGLVEKGTFKRDNDGLTSHFIITDTAKTIPVVYKGILPDLFKEGKGCVAQGRIGSDGVFYADQVLAKHDENYMPPQAGQAIDAAQHERDSAKTVVDK